MIAAAFRQLAAHLAQAAWEVKAILDLFARSIRERGRGFHWAGVYGALRWGVSRRTADRLILRLEEMGHIAVLDRGDRHTPRTVRMHLIPLRDVDLAGIRKARREVQRRLNPGLACPHTRLPPTPPHPDHCPLALSDDPAPCWIGNITPDPLALMSRIQQPDFARIRSQNAVMSPTDLLDLPANPSAGLLWQSPVPPLSPLR